MKAFYKSAIVYAQGDIRLEEVEKKSLKSDEVFIEIHKANICPTDLRGFRGAKPLDTPENVGHEFAGYIVEVGSEVTKFKVGDKVTALSWTPCYQCRKCTRGKYSACEHKKMNMGGFGEYIALKESVVYKIPNDMSLELASCTEPLASVLKANVEITPVQAGDTVVVYGLGPMGQLHLQVAKLLGATKVIGIDLLPNRLEIASKLGADHVINPTDVNPIDEVFRLTDGEGADLIMVAVGGVAEAPCTESAIKMAAYGARINIFTGTYPYKDVLLDPNLVHYKELIVTGTRSYNPKMFELSLELLASGKINVDLIREPTISLEEIKMGFEIHGTKDAMKVAVDIR
jgi:L-iditol 2-dehydrogenase